MNKKAVNRAGICGVSDQAIGDSVVSSWVPVAFKNERTLQVQGSQMSSLDSNMAYSHGSNTSDTAVEQTPGELIFPHEVAGSSAVCRKQDSFWPGHCWLVS